MIWGKRIAQFCYCFLLLLITFHQIQSAHVEVEKWPQNNSLRKKVGAQRNCWIQCSAAKTSIESVLHKKKCVFVERFNLSKIFVSMWMNQFCTWDALRCDDNVKEQWTLMFSKQDVLDEFFLLLMRCWWLRQALLKSPRMRSTIENVDGKCNQDRLKNADEIVQ